MTHSTTSMAPGIPASSTVGRDAGVTYVHFRNNTMKGLNAAGRGLVGEGVQLLIFHVPLSSEHIHLSANTRKQSCQTDGYQSVIVVVLIKNAT